MAPPLRRIGARTAALAATVALAAWSWLRAEHVDDDRGSDSSEKALMVVLAIALGTAVSAAAIAFIAFKTSLFK